MRLDIKGLIAAVFSPFDKSGCVDMAPIPKLVEHLIDNGINGLYAMGSTGEGLSMTVRQRMDVTEAYIGAVDGRIPVIVNVSHTSYDATEELIRHAVGAGA
ncbi:dihydrodipicolinate synthase family protein, partial [Zobellia galactanivorans]